MRLLQASATYLLVPPLLLKYSHNPLGTQKSLNCCSVGGEAQGSNMGGTIVCRVGGQHVAQLLGKN
jgi:hypothetical protein